MADKFKPVTSEMLEMVEGLVSKYFDGDERDKLEASYKDSGGITEIFAAKIPNSGSRVYGYIFHLGSPRVDQESFEAHAATSRQRGAMVKDIELEHFIDGKVAGTKISMSRSRYSRSINDFRRIVAS